MAAARRHSFTVIEMIIVMAIFSIVLGVVIQIFIFTSRTQRRSRSIQEAYAEARTALEAVGREIQNGSIDYSSYPSPGDLSAAVSVVALRDTQALPVKFRCVEFDGEGVATGNPCDPATPERGRVEQCRGNDCAADSASWAPLTGERTDVVSLRVWLGPDLDPFQHPAGDSSSYQSNEQPWMTAVIEIQPSSVSGEQLPPVQLQSTVSSRSYLR